MQVHRVACQLFCLCVGQVGRVEVATIAARDAAGLIVNRDAQTCEALRGNVASARHDHVYGMIARRQCVQVYIWQHGAHEHARAYGTSVSNPIMLGLSGANCDANPGCIALF